MEKLAIDGGPRVRQKPFPPRYLLGEEEKQAVLSLFEKVISTGEAIVYNGPEEEAYCKEFAEFMGGGYADAVNSGTSALFVALHALDPEPFTEVIVSAVTDPGGMMPILFLNCIPVIADTAPDSYNTCAEEIAKLISPLTSAIVVAHIGGEPADIERIAALARERGIPLIEDCAQSHGAKMNGKYVGSFGDIAVFSTMFGKHFSSGGQGGIVYTKNGELYWKIRQAADRGKPFGLPEGSTNCIASMNFNSDELHCAIGRVQLRKLPSIVERRREIVAEIAEGIKDLKIVSIPEPLPGADPSYWFLRMRFHREKSKVDKERFCQALSAEGLIVTPSYRFALPHLMDWFRNRAVFGKSGYPWTSPDYKGDPDKKFPTPNALSAMETNFNLAIYESWGKEEIDDIVEALRKVGEAYQTD
ncbi:DegT/DnrJ/EryC1/StrS family aminotransferase [bacterium]|nr:DegT/DnrJ/EryC1/StrS family aminotransferase [bacterium]